MARLELDREQVRLAAMGPALKLVSRACRIVLTDAKRTVRVDTGRLRASLNSKITVRLYTINGRIGSRVKYSLVEHNGAKKHVIRAVRGQYMKFYWKKVGKVVWLRRVNHPGTRGSFYLTTPMIKLLPPRGFRVSRFRDSTTGPGSL
jgi:hypothetical protein